MGRRVYRVCDEHSVPPGVMLAVEINGDSFVICNVGGRISAVAGLCSHGAALLSEGELIGGEIKCPLHFGRFDVKTGAPTRRPAMKPIATYDCKMEGGQVFLVIESWRRWPWMKRGHTWGKE